MICFNIGPFEFDISSLISFATGLIFGAIILFLVYLYALVKSIDTGMKRKAVEEEDIDVKEIILLIRDAEKQFKDKEERTNLGYAKHLISICRELSTDICKKFYPKSDKAYLELTVDESFTLIHYITNRVDELLSGKIVKLFRGMTIKQIFDLNNTKNKIENTGIVKVAKKTKAVEISKSILKVLNAVNPVYWLKKVTLDSAMSIILNKIGIAIIRITGEETYKIYSKKIFKTDSEIDTSVDDIYDELNEELAKEFRESEKDIKFKK
ncbi:MAG: hypothetical protein LBV58_02590 [Acholeplasmatales bacterium]|nr:hypothetical protein [Acholeplasmatales bacterium]